MKNIKFNLGAGPIWKNEGWYILDHKINKSTGFLVSGDALNINLPDESCDFVFCSHVFEHIPHTRLPLVISEINRILAPGGLLRILTPDLERIARAYVDKDDEFFKQAKLEDESMRTDLGYGGILMNFIVSPGQDTVLLDRSLKSFIAGYAHIYSYDYDMLNILFSELGFKSRRADFCDSELDEVKVPMHVTGMEPTWKNLNQDFYNQNGLIHKLVDGKYQINFTVSGFDRDPLTSLIIESKKEKYISKEFANEKFNNSLTNYNRYSKSLLRDEFITSKFDEWKIEYK